MKNNKKIKSIILVLLLPLVSLILLMGVSCGYKPAFFNFEDYMDNKGKSSINKNFNYSVFGDTEEFEGYVKSNKTVGGITNLYSAAKLVQEGYGQKIDFEKLFGIANPTSLYTKKTLEYLNYYDQFLFPKGNDHFYNYVIPYYLQAKVVAYNINRGDHPGQKGLDFNNDYSWNNILKTLQKNGYQHLGINNYFRDNLMIGSTLKANLNQENFMNNSLNKNNYINYADNFINLINNYFPNRKSQFITDGSSLILNLIDPFSNQDSAILYNGDALDAYYAKNNIASEANGQIRVVYPSQTIYQLDGIMIVKQSVSKLSDESLNNLYADLREGVYDGANPLLYDNDLKNSPLYENFLYNKYTSPYASINNIIKEDLFHNKDNPIDAYAYNNIFQLPLTWNPSENIPMFIPDNISTLAKNYYYNLVLKNYAS